MRNHNLVIHNGKSAKARRNDVLACDHSEPARRAMHIFRSRGVGVRSEHRRPYARARTSLAIESQNIFFWKIKFWT